MFSKIIHCGITGLVGHQISSCAGWCAEAAISLASRENANALLAVGARSSSDTTAFETTSMIRTCLPPGADSRGAK